MRLSLLTRAFSARGGDPKGPVEPSAAKVQLGDTVVTDVGTKHPTLVAWTQYGWSWMSNTAQVSPGTRRSKMHLKV